MNQLIQKVLAVALEEAQNHVREIGHTNTGRRVEEYQAADNLAGGGYSWCASFVAWVLLTALGKPLMSLVWFNSASCDAVLDWARRRNIVSSKPVAGCAGLVMAGRNNATHIFLVEEVLDNGFWAIEGNTNNDGSREGNGVYRRFRKFSDRYLFVVWAELIPAQIVEPAKPATYALLLAGGLTGQPVDNLPVIEGESWCLAWKWAHWMGFREDEVGLNPASQCVVIGGREVGRQPRFVDGRAILPIRVLAEFSHMVVSVDNTKREILVKQATA